MKKYLILLFLLIPFVSFAADIDCDSTTLQAAINAASDGGTITCKAGSFTWTASPTIPATKGLTITGKGTATETGTLITHAGKPLIINLADANSLVDISGFKITKSASGSSIILYNSNNPPVYTGDPMFRIHGNYFEDATYSGTTIAIENYAYGLIDNNTLHDFGSYGIFTRYGITGESSAAVEGAWAWSQTQALGTNKAVYIENNTFSTTKGSSTIAISGNSGAKYVARYNNITGSSISSHSGCTGGRYQPMWLESYFNKIDYNAYYGLLWYRAASGIMWNNAFPLSVSSTVARVDFERSYRSDCNTTYTTINALCNGTVDIDGNTAEMNGWPCMGQPGYGPVQTTITGGSVTDNGMDLGYVFSGLFAWGNTNKTSAITLGYNGSYAAQTAHIAFGRELYNTANMTVGGSKPATCTAATGTSGRDIWVDTSSSTSPVIWQCSATNTWTQHWTPYTCPHPLAGSGTCGAAAGTAGYSLGSVAPTLSAATLAADGVTLSLVFSRAITKTGDGTLTVTPSSGVATAAYASGSTSTTLVYTLSRAISSTATGGSLTISYTQGGNDLEATDDGQDVSSFTNTPVTNNSEQGNTLKTVTPSAGTGCHISPDTAQTIVSGQATNFYYGTDPNYQFSAWGGTCGGTGTTTYTTSAITADCTVSVSCSKIAADNKVGSAGLPGHRVGAGNPAHKRY